MISITRTALVTALAAGMLLFAYWALRSGQQERTIAELRVLNDEMELRLAAREAMIERLARSRRVAHVQVLEQRVSASGRSAGTIEETELLFIELDDEGTELARQAFTIPGDVLFVDAWTVKFEHDDVAAGHPLFGRTLVLLRRIYSDRMAPIDGFPIDTPGAVPPGYAASDMGRFEQRLWTNFWEIASDPNLAASMGVRVAQGEVIYKPVVAGRTYALIIDAAGGMSLTPLLEEDEAVFTPPSDGASSPRHEAIAQRRRPGSMAETLPTLERSITRCRRCPELREYCAEIARARRRAYREFEYWGRPVPGFGDRRGKIMILGLAPGAHGANRTGRMFTGDRSGDFLYAALFRAGLANQSESADRADGLALRGVYVTNALRCAPPANKPQPAQLANCAPYLIDEMRLLRPAVTLCLGGIAWKAALAAFRSAGIEIPRPRPPFGHGREQPIGETTMLLGCYHVSQQNTFTGRLTEEMIDAVLARAKSVAGV